MGVLPKCGRPRWTCFFEGKGSDADTFTEDFKFVSDAGHAQLLVRSVATSITYLEGNYNIYHYLNCDNCPL